MIIPIRCVSCGKVLADKWRYYERKLDEGQRQDPTTNQKNLTAKTLDELGLTRYCCRRVMLGHVELVDVI